MTIDVIDACHIHHQESDSGYYDRSHIDPLGIVYLAFSGAVGRLSGPPRSPLYCLHVHCHGNSLPRPTARAIYIIREDTYILDTA